jgi:hypothetical protein
MRLRILVPLAAFALLACEAEHATIQESKAHALLAVPPPVQAAPVQAPDLQTPADPTAEVPPKAIVASPDDARRLAEDDQGCADPNATAFRGFRGMTESFPWGKDGSVWPGTGHPDPEPLRNVSNEEMMKRATSEGDDDSGDRAHALISVARRHLPGALTAIAQAQGHGEPVTIREMAVSALIEHGGPQALPMMWNGMSDPSHFVRGMSVWAIALYGHDEALKAINAAEKDANVYVYGMGVLAVTSLRTEADAWPILTRAAAHKEQMVYQEACYVLTNINSTRARNALRAAYDSASDPLRRSTFRFCLKENLRNKL